MESLVKENIKANKVMTENIQEFWSMKRPNLRIVWVEKEEYKLKGTEKIQQNHIRKLSQPKE